MSRIGKKPIELKDNVELITANGSLKVRGPKGELEISLDDLINVKTEDRKVFIEALSDTKKAKELHGLTRSLVFNMIVGVTEGFEKRLEIKGVGYRAIVEGDELVLSVGYSHPVRYRPKNGAKVEVDKSTIIVSGSDRQIVGQVAAEIRSIKKPEPYKGKGIRYSDEKVRRKAGKAAAKGSS